LVLVFDPIYRFRHLRKTILPKLLNKDTFKGREHT
jgi:hypothetical protein